MSPAKSFWSSLPGILTAVAGVIGALGTLVGALYMAGIIGHREKTPAVDAQPRQEAKAMPASPATDAAARMRLRTSPATLSSEMVNAVLVKHGFYEKNRNADGKGLAHQYDPHNIGDAVVVVDRATGLMWQKGGSGPLTLSAAETHVGGLNAERFAGFGNWRLPTLEEAMSLMEPQALGGVHVAPVFQRTESFIWTADRATDGGSWLLYFHDGALGAETPPSTRGSGRSVNLNAKLFNRQDHPAFRRVPGMPLFTRFRPQPRSLTPPHQGGALNIGRVCCPVQPWDPSVAPWRLEGYFGLGFMIRYSPRATAVECHARG